MRLLPVVLRTGCRLQQGTQTYEDEDEGVYHSAVERSGFKGHGEKRMIGPDVHADANANAARIAS
jgi:hypothetical protein